MGQAAAPSSTRRSQPAPSQRKDVPDRADSKAGMQFQGNASSKKCESENFHKTVNDSRASAGKVNIKRKRRTQDSESSEDDVAIDEDGNLQATKDSGFGEHPRRSARQKQKVSYNEPLSDDDGEASSPKRAKSGESIGDAIKPEKNKQSGAPADNLEEGIDVPDPEFHSFDDERTIENFQVGEIWSVYSDEDSLPKYYGQIKKIYSKPEVSVEIKWLEISSVPDGTIEWSDRNIPVSCGFFKLKRGIQSYSSTDCFSHRVAANECSRNLFEIIPRKGEIWALYRNWRSDISCTELGKCEYDIVQVHQVNDTDFNVLHLERLTGYNTVFKPCIDGGSPMIRSVYQVELFRFSHQIPAFQLSDENGGSLKGFWVLDPAAFPVSYFSLK